MFNLHYIFRFPIFLYKEDYRRLKIDDNEETLPDSQPEPVDDVGQEKDNKQSYNTQGNIQLPN